jgi:hypothetical protein
VDKASTQQVEVMVGKDMTSLSLDGCRYADLLAPQPGVGP